MPEGLQKVLAPQAGHTLADISVGGMHVLLTQVFWVQKFPSSQPELLTQGSSVATIVCKKLCKWVSIIGVSVAPASKMVKNTHPQGT